jgi:hypothetical protein
MSNRHIGSNFDDFLKDENLLEHSICIAKSRINKLQAKTNIIPKSTLNSTDSTNLNSRARLIKI